MGNLKFMKESKKQYSDVKRPTVQLTPAEHKTISHFCIDNGMRVGDFLRRAALYCAENNINFEKK